jgi:hypothetical protein
MKIFRTATLIVLCLGLALPSAHALALCIDSDGSFALDVAVNGACSGSRARGDDRERTPAESFSRAADAVDCRGSCTDVVLGGGGVAVPPPALSGKRGLSRPTDEAVDPINAPGNSLPRASGTISSSSAPIPERPPTGDSVVLRL